MFESKKQQMQMFKMAKKEGLTIRKLAKNYSISESGMARRCKSACGVVYSQLQIKESKEK